MTKLVPILPLELETNILSRLPFTSILRFRCVCKEWLSVIDSKNFKIPKPLFFDIKIGDTPAGRIVMELFVDVTPQTADKFRTIYTGEKGVEIPLHFQCLKFQRVINKFMYSGDGTGGESVFEAKFADKFFIKKHTGRGVFRQVVERMNVVKAIEAVGSSSRKTSKPVVIADSGQL